MRALLVALSLLVVAGTIAQATPDSGEIDPDPIESVSPSPEQAPEEDAEPAPETEPVDEGEVAEEEAGVAAEGGADFSSCAGMTGLENAACRVDANYADHHNDGLENASSHLHDNQAAHAAADEATEGDGTEDDGDETEADDQGRTGTALRTDRTHAEPEGPAFAGPSAFPGCAGSGVQSRHAVGPRGCRPAPG